MQVETSQLDDGLLKTEIVFAEVGRRNDSSYLHIIGRLESPEHNLESLSLLIQGRDMSSGILFSMPWTVLDKGDPPLRTGETLPLTSFRWLAEGEENIQRIELITLEKNHLANPGTPVLSEVEVVWEAPRPEGSALTAEARNRRFVEAYDRQVVLMDIILENTGVSAL